MLQTMIITVPIYFQSGLFGLFFVLSAHGQNYINATSQAPQFESNATVEREADTHPLKPADTSSPRDTLSGFMADIDMVKAEWTEIGKLQSMSSYWAYSRAVSVLDFSTTPDKDSRTIQNQRMLMLREILDRVDIPPYDEIPGDNEVAQRAVSQWTVPNTSITIERIERGPRFGEVLFSHDTVEHLDRFYRMIKHLPYRMGVTSGFYEAYLHSTTTDAYLERQIRNRLRPVDMSTPRSTLMGFIDSVNRVYVLVMEADAALRANPQTMTNEEAREVEITAQNLMKRALATLDLSQIPEALREDVGIECALQLKEIIDRMNVPPIDFIPDAAMVAAERERLGKISTGIAVPVRWRYPNTAIEIVEILEGEHQGSFQFSVGTVSRLDEFYEKVGELPYRRDYIQIAMDYASPGISAGFYEYYISTPGRLIPR
jgi:MscS family membrane protein